MDKVVIGADPHKHLVTIEVLDEPERVDGYRQILAEARRFAQRLWAVEGCNGARLHNRRHSASRAPRLRCS